MRINLTRNFLTRSAGLVALMLCGYVGFSQGQATLTVADGAAAGTYDVLPGLWGAYAPGTTATAEIAIADDGQSVANGAFPGSPADGCEAFLNDVSGKMVLIDRTFTCSSRDVFDNATGAAGIILCPNNLDRDYDAFIRARGADLQNTDFPVLTVTAADCVTIKAAINAGETVTATYDILGCESNVPADVVWGENGEGTFAEEGNGWEVSGEGWRYDPQAYVARGAFNGTLGYARTTTSCNGAYVFDSDFLDNAGNGSAAFGTGECPSLTFAGAALDPPCTSVLTSPVIDLTGSTFNSFVLQFDQVLRQFDQSYFVATSPDAGMTWDTIQINAQYPTNSNHIAETIRVPLCGITSGTQLQFRFIAVGGYYYWGIDDVYLVADEVVDVRGNENFFATAPNFRTPQSQLDFHPFLIDVENVGNADADGVSVTAAIGDANGDVVFQTTRDYGVVPTCFLDENKTFTETFDMSDLEVGAYSTNYFTSAANNTEGDIESRASTWEITESVFSKVVPESEVGAYLGNFGAVAFTHYTVGNYYRVNEECVAIGTRAGLAFQGGTYDTDNGITEFIAFVEAFVYAWEDANNDGQCSPDERIVLGSGFVEPESADADLGDFVIDFEDENGNPPTIPAGTDVLVMMDISSIDPLSYPLRFKAADVTDNRSFDYGAMRLASNDVGMPRFGSMLANGSEGNERDRIYGPVGNLTAYMPLFLEPVSTQEEINEDIAFRIFPNPASDFINIDMDLDEVSETVRVTLTDATGRVAADQSWSDVQRGTLKLDVNGLTPGAYIANIRTEAGFTSQSVMIAK